MNISAKQKTVLQKDIIIGQFKSLEEYKNFSENSLVDIFKEERSWKRD